MGIINIEERGRIVIPQKLRQELNLRAGTKFIIEKRNNEIVLKPVIDKETFKRELKGCVKNSVIDPMDVKKIWKM